MCYFTIMYLLLGFLVPAAFIYYKAGCRDVDSTVNILSYTFGLVAGGCSLLIGHFIGTFFPHDTSSFILKFVSFFIVESIIPFIGGIAALFFLFEYSPKQRVSNIRPQLFGIMTIYLPYILWNSYNFPDVWSLVMLPSILISILFLADFCIGRYISMISRSIDVLDFILALLPILLALLVTDLCKTLWFFCYPSWIIIGISIFLVFFAAGLRFLKYRK
jgi:hypothetical protein